MRGADGSARDASRARSAKPASRLSRQALRQILPHLSRLADRAARLSRRLLPRHHPPLPADDHDHPAVGRDLRRGQETTGKTKLAGYDYRRNDRLPAADAHQPGVFVDAGIGGRHRPRHPRRLAQEVPDSAARHARLLALLPGGPQGRLHRHRGDAVRRCCSRSVRAYFTHFRTP